jgi:hypothetical protein
VGSAAVQPLQDGSGDVNLFVPAYELNKVRQLVLFLFLPRSLLPCVVGTE